MATAAKHNDHEDRETTIVVNAQHKVVAGKELTYDQLVRLAYSTPPTGENVLVTVSYRRGEGNKPEGTLVAGQSIKVKEGMIFNVRATDKS